MKAKRILASVLSVALLLQLSPLGVLALDESLPQTPQVSTVQENLDPAPTEEPALVADPVPTAEPIPEETAVPMAAPTPEPTAAPAEEPAPDAEETPAPEPSAEPTAAPDPAAAVQTMIDALPDEVTDDNAEAVGQALTDIDDAKQSLTDDELAGLDFARYDAAANALLALWGEAPADAVETLDNYAQPGIDATDGYYQITTEGELSWFAEAVNNGDTSSNARLMNDITINRKVLSDDGSLISDPSSLKSWTPIGTDADGMRFTGTFDGQNHTITGLYIDGTADYVGLFGCIGKNSIATGTVKDVTLADSYVSGKDYVGGICGYNNGGTLQGCRNTGKVSGNIEVGGVCGWNYIGIVQESYNIGEVSSKNYVGGVCGLGNGTVKGCYNIGKVTGESKVGGVCGGGNSSTDCCYLDTSAKTSEDGTAKTAAAFESGEVAYLLQKALDDAAAANTTAPQVWGQTLTGASPETYPVLGGAKVYQTSPCTGYSNTQDNNRQHNYVDGVCSNCGEWQEAKQAADGYYEINNQWQLRWFADQVNNKGQTTINARLTADIKLNGNNNVLAENDDLISDPSSLKPWTPIGTIGDPFTGTFDGNNKTIHGLYINGTTGCVGLFGCVGVNGKVINVTVADSYVSGNSDVGGIYGLNTGGTLQGCHNIGTVSGASHVGGVCGINKNSGTIQKCDNAGTVSGTEFFVGGVCGTNDDSATLEKSYNTGDVSGNSYVGGVCGLNGGNGTVNGCYNTGTVRGSYSGSVCGANYSTVQNCYYLGGTNSKAFGSGTGANCKSKNNLQFPNGDVAFCLQNDLGQNAEPVWGQRIGTDKTPVLSSETDYKVYHPTSGTSPCTGGYNNTGDGTLAHKYENSACIYCGEPEPPKDVEGYYQIINQWQLRWFAKEVNNGRTDINARLMNDITMDDTKWTPIGTSDEHPFKGTFDGNGHTISKLTCTDAGAEYVGLVGYASGTIIQNVTVKDSSFVGERYIGAVCGSIKDGTITGCTNSGSTVSGNYYLGGIAGYAEYTPVKRCVNTGNVTGKHSAIGGIVGQAYGAAVWDCGNTGAVTKTDPSSGYYGGIIGEVLSQSNIQNCYNADKETAAKIYDGDGRCRLYNCYYLPDDTNSSGSTGRGITAKTQAQFNSGEVAYLLQNEHGDTAVWGQTIGKDKYPKLGGDKVYQSAPCPANYTNTAQQTLDHSYTEDGVCSRCGEWQEAIEVDGYYQITNQGQLRWFANLVNTTSNGETKINARLTQDITMDGTEWTPIGAVDHPFTGEFDGNGKTITGLTCTNASKYYVGLVGYAVGATIQNVTVQDSSFNGHIYIGAVCGYIKGGTIKNCHAVGTTIGDSDRADDSQYLGGIVGHMTGNNVVTDCTNSGTVSGCWSLGGIAGFAGTNTTVQRCFNSGAVTGRHAKFGGIVGQTSNATVQDCGNTGAVSEFTPSSGSQYGGIVGLAESDSTIQNCYNADKNTAAKICGSYSCDLSNCYYLLDDTGSSGSTVPGITAKTAEQFASGEVAYLLQGNRTESVWGQTLTGATKQNYPVLNGAPVYQGTPCTGRYSNTKEELNHDYRDGNCIYCGQPEIAYTVTIPATVELGNAANATATISAENVTLPTDKTLKVTVNGPFTATLVGTTDVTAQYTIQKDGTALESGAPVLTAKSGESPKIPLTFVKPDAAPYAGSYTGTVTFEVSVG